MAEPISVIGVADDHETEIKRARVLDLANATLAEIGAAVRVPAADVEIIAADHSEYGEAEPETIDIIRRFARAEGIVADPVYEGKALRGLEKLIGEGYFHPTAKVLILHLGGTPAVHAYADQFGAPAFKPLPADWPGGARDRA
jgi:1-aminocyclopropane-1-carboxylate deaminase/D-cysteine desulfhydrase-like pyridoxal-dependent ACC family enzyme